MQYGEALRLIGGLSAPTKMPGWSWSISAEDCITGSKLRQVPGSTCGSCYALKGNYRFPVVKATHARRREGLDSPDFVEAFVTVLTRIYSNQRKPEDRFRWFDAGDLPSFEALQKIIEIARRTPQIRHWLPTREFAIVRQLDPALIPSNLTIRMSAPMIGEPVTPLPGTTWSGVDLPDLFACPAPTQGNQCLDCSACWGMEPVSYHLH